MRFFDKKVKPTTWPSVDCTFLTKKWKNSVFDVLHLTFCSYLTSLILADSGKMLEFWSSVAGLLQQGWDLKNEVFWQKSKTHNLAKRRLHLFEQKVKKRQNWLNLVEFSQNCWFNIKMLKISTSKIWIWRICVKQQCNGFSGQRVFSVSKSNLEGVVWQRFIAESEWIQSAAESVIFASKLPQKFFALM